MHEQSETIELVVRVVAGSDPIRGDARLAGEQSIEFWGWLELAPIVHNATDARQPPAGAAGGCRAPPPEPPQSDLTPLFPIPKRGVQ